MSIGKIYFNGKNAPPGTSTLSQEESRRILEQLFGALLALEGAHNARRADTRARIAEGKAKAQAASESWAAMEAARSKTGNEAVAKFRRERRRRERKLVDKLHDFSYL